MNDDAHSPRSATASLAISVAAIIVTLVMTTASQTLGTGCGVRPQTAIGALMPGSAT